VATAIICFSFPDTIPRKPGLLPARQQFLGQEFVSRLVGLRRGWEPDFPDRIHRRRTHAAYAPFGSWPAQSFILPPAPIVGRSIYPDILRRKVTRQTAGSASVFFAPNLSLFTWRGVYPERVVRRRFTAERQLAWVFGFQSAAPPPFLSWEGTWPDKLYPRQGLLAGAQLPSAQNLDPLPNAPSPDGAWKGLQPDYLWPRPGLSAPRQQVFTLEPIRPFTPVLSWQGWQPEAARGRFLTTAQRPFLAFQFRIIAPDIEMRWAVPTSDLIRARVRPPGGEVRPTEVPVTPVVWYFERQDPPDQLLRRTWLIPSGAASSPALVVLSSLPHWSASYPDYLWARPTPVERGSTVVVPSVPTPAPGVVLCIEPESVVGLSPSLEPDYVLTPHIAHEFLIAPTITSDGVC